MGRLTKYSNDIIRNKAINIIRKLSDRNGLNGDELAVVSAFCLIERTENKVLKEYEELEEQGRPLKLPAPVGSLVYEPYRFLEEGAWEIDEHKIRLEDLEKIGKSVFLTKDAAEDASKKI